ncbi:hypothetical protein [Halostella salina]|uniref:hypothetical protein n=1 Tax=Halostella salina TaxID=1547897 RepID=UPI000EF7DC45|nr:hypothetical protein [Halostella salina]
MPAGSVLFAFLLLLALVAPLVLYALVSAEADDTERLDREAAERRVRRDAADDHGSPEDDRGDDGRGADGDDYDPWSDRDGDRNGWN